MSWRPKPPEGYRLIDKVTEEPLNGDYIWVMWDGWTKCRDDYGPFHKDSHYARKIDHPDEWVTQDRVPARQGIDQYRYVGGINNKNTKWEPVYVLSVMHGTPIYILGDARVELRCRRRDLPARAVLGGPYVAREAYQAVVVERDSLRQQITKYHEPAAQKEDFITRAELQTRCDIHDKIIANLELQIESYKRLVEEMKVRIAELYSQCKLQAGTVEILQTQSEADKRWIEQLQRTARHQIFGHGSTKFWKNWQNNWNKKEK